MLPGCSSAGITKFAEELLVLAMPSVLEFSKQSSSAQHVADEDREGHQRHDAEHDVIVRRDLALRRPRRTVAGLGFADVDMAEP